MPKVKNLIFYNGSRSLGLITFFYLILYLRIKYSVFIIKNPFLYRKNSGLPAMAKRRGEFSSSEFNGITHSNPFCLRKLNKNEYIFTFNSKYLILKAL
jgi:hypothetical protein